MKSAADHLQKFPNARPSTIAFIERRNAMLEKLKSEIEASRRPALASIIHRLKSWLWRRA